MLKNKRIWLLLALTAIVLLFRILDLEEQLQQINWTAAGIVTTISGHRLAIDKVLQKNPDTAGLSPAFQAGLQPGDRIVAMYNSSGQGGAIRGRMDADWALRAVSNQQTWTIVVERGGASRPVETLRLAMTPIPHQSVPGKFLAIRIAARDLIPLIAIVTALVIGLAKPDDPNALIVCLLLAFTTLFGITYRPVIRDVWIVLRIAGLYFTPYLILRFFLLFPSPSPLERRAPWVKASFLALATASFLYDAVATTIFQESFAPQTLMGANFVDRVLRYVLWVTLALAFVSLLLNIFQSQSRDERRRLGILLTGLAGLIPLAVLLSVGEERLPVWFWVLAVAAAALFPLSFFYVVVKHRVFGIKVFLRRGLQYALVARGFRLVQVGVIFVLLTLFSNWFFRRFFAHVTLFGLMIYVMIVAVVVSMVTRRMNRRVMQALDRRFFRDAYNAQHVLRDLSRAVRQLATEPGRLIETVADQISSALHSDQVAIFLLGAQLLPASLADPLTVKATDSEGPQAGTQIVPAGSRVVLGNTRDYRCCALRRTSRGPSAHFAARSDSEMPLLPGTAFISRCSTGLPKPSRSRSRFTWTIRNRGRTRWRAATHGRAHSTRNVCCWNG